MYLNVSRYESRINDNLESIDISKQDRSKWNRELINKGLDMVYKCSQDKLVNKYLILAMISANHCTAPSFSQTNWEEILSLYDSLLKIENSALVLLNRSIAISYHRGPEHSIKELLNLSKTSDIAKQYLYHATLAWLYNRLGNSESAIKSYEIAIQLCTNKRDVKSLERKMSKIVPISRSRM